MDFSRITPSGTQNLQFLRFLFGKPNFTDRVTRLRNNTRANSDSIRGFCKSLNLSSGQFWKRLREQLEELQMKDMTSEAASARLRARCLSDDGHHMSRYLRVVVELDEDRMVEEAALTL